MESATSYVYTPSWLTMPGKISSKPCYRVNIRDEMNMKAALTLRLRMTADYIRIGMGRCLH